MTELTKKDLKKAQLKSLLYEPISILSLIAFKVETEPSLKELAKMSLQSLEKAVRILEDDEKI